MTKNGQNRVGEPTSQQSPQENFQERPSVQIQYNCVSSMIVVVVLSRGALRFMQSIMLQKN